MGAPQLQTPPLQPPQSDLAVELRAGTAADHPYLFSSWLKCYSLDSTYAKSIRRALFFRRHHYVLRGILERAQVRIAAPPGDPLTILGYLVTERTPGELLVHFVHVKESFRGFGIARRLMADLPPRFRYTHRTYAAEPILRRWEEERAFETLECRRCEHPVLRTESPEKGELRLECRQCKWTTARPLGARIPPRPKTTYDPYLLFGGVIPWPK